MVTLYHLLFLWFTVLHISVLEATMFFSTGNFVTAPIGYIYYALMFVLNIGYVYELFWLRLPILIFLYMKEKESIRKNYLILAFNMRTNIIIDLVRFSSFLHLFVWLLKVLLTEMILDFLKGDLKMVVIIRRLQGKLDFRKYCFETDREECSICLDDEREGEYCILKCDHSFHVDCIEDWHTHSIMEYDNAYCPICRTEIC
jgi:hypothetical protein